MSDSSDIGSDDRQNGATNSAAPESDDVPSAESPQTGSTPRYFALNRWSPRLNATFRKFGFDPPSRWLGLLGVSVVVYIVFLSWIQFQEYAAYFTYSQDLGVFTQSLYTAAFDGRLFYYTSNLPAGSNGTFFAVHFSPLLFALVPVYAIAPTPTTLLVTKVLAIGAAAFPAFGISRRVLGSSVWGLLFGIIYLINPVTLTIDWSSFDLEVFLPFFVLTAIYFLIRERWIPFFAFWLFALATIETVAPFLAVFAAISLLSTYLGGRLDDKAKRRTVREVYLVSIAIAVGWFLLADVVIRSVGVGGGVYGAAYSAHYEVLGATSLSQVLPLAITHPSSAWAALSFQGEAKIDYVLVLFGAFAFIPIFGKVRYWLPVVAWLCLALLSNTPQFYSLGTEYMGYVCPFLVVGAIDGTDRLRTLCRRIAAGAHARSSTPSGTTTPSLGRPIRKGDIALASVLVVSVLVTATLAGPFVANPVDGLSYDHYGIPTPDAHALLLDRIIALIPSHASVLTTSNLFPQVSNRLNAFVLPQSQIFTGSGTFWGWLDSFINDSTYVLLDFTLDSYQSQLIEFFGNFSAFGVRAAADGIFLLERGWNGGNYPGIWMPSSIDYTGARIATNSKTIVASNQSLRFQGKGLANQGIWRTPLIQRIQPGEYELTVNYRLSTNQSKPVLTFLVNETPLEVNAEQYLNSTSGHHYNYVFESAGPAFTLTNSTIQVPPSELDRWLTGSLSLKINVSSLASIQAFGRSGSAAPFSLYVSSLDIVAVGPPAQWSAPQ